MGFISLLIGTLGAILSWVVNHSVWWAILHFIIAPLYIPYWIAVHSSLCDFFSEWIK